MTTEMRAHTAETRFDIYPNIMQLDNGQLVFYFPIFCRPYLFSVIFLFNVYYYHIPLLF